MFQGLICSNVELFLNLLLGGQRKINFTAHSQAIVNYLSWHVGLNM
jgi:hypothetical protein